MMAASMIILHLMCLLLWGEVAFVQLSVEEHQKSFLMADIGDNVTLHCFNQDIYGYKYWYKQCLGDKPVLLHSEFPQGKTILSKELKSNPRFTVILGERINQLNISDVQFSDSAMYYCGVGTSAKLHFKEGILLHVKGSSSSIQAIVQEPPEKSVLPGDSVTLNCTVHTEPCAGEHSVYCFRQSEKSQPIFFYTHDQRCEIANTTQGSFYNFSMKNLKPRDAGTYYCAVASCGEILYGNGTKLDIEDDCSNLRRQVRILVLLSIIRTGVVLCFLLILTIIYITKK